MKRFLICLFVTLLATAAFGAKDFKVRRLFFTSDTMFLNDGTTITLTDLLETTPTLPQTIAQGNNAAGTPANYATTSTFASNASTATYATDAANADYASIATTADTATTSSYATTSTYASTAAAATTADNATTSTFADNATTSIYATDTGATLDDIASNGANTSTTLAIEGMNIYDRLAISHSNNIYDTGNEALSVTRVLTGTTTTVGGTYAIWIDLDATNTGAKDGGDLDGFRINVNDDSTTTCVGYSLYGSRIIIDSDHASVPCYGVRIEATGLGDNRGIQSVANSGTANYSAWLDGTTYIQNSNNATGIEFGSLGTGQYMIKGDGANIGVGDFYLYLTSARYWAGDGSIATNGAVVTSSYISGVTHCRGGYFRPGATSADLILRLTSNSYDFSFQDSTSVEIAAVDAKGSMFFASQATTPTARAGFANVFSMAVAGTPTSSSFTLAGTGANVDWTSHDAWSNPGNITAEDNVYANQDTGAGPDYTDWIRASNFGFAIPTGATINGITVQVTRLSDGVGAQDAAVAIVKADGSYGSENKGTSATWSNAVEETVKYGDSDDLWSETWTAANINDVDFGVVIRAIGDTADNLKIDSIQIAVSYTPAIAELFAMDDAGNYTQLSSHIGGEKVIHDGNVFTGVGRIIREEAYLKALSGGWEANIDDFTSTYSFTPSSWDRAESENVARLTNKIKNQKLSDNPDPWIPVRLTDAIETYQEDIETTCVVTRVIADLDTATTRTVERVGRKKIGTQTRKRIKEGYKFDEVTGRAYRPKLSSDIKLAPAERPVPRPKPEWLKAAEAAPIVR